MTRRAPTVDVVLTLSEEAAEVLTILARDIGGNASAVVEGWCSSARHVLPKRAKLRVVR
jgi:hypothetical protein